MLNKTGTHVFWEKGVHYPRVSPGAHPLTKSPRTLGTRLLWLWPESVFLALAKLKSGLWGPKWPSGSFKLCPAKGEFNEQNIDISTRVFAFNQHSP